MQRVLAGRPSTWRRQRELLCVRPQLPALPAVSKHSIHLTSHPRPRVYIFPPHPTSLLCMWEGVGIIEPSVLHAATWPNPCLRPSVTLQQPHFCFGCYHAHPVAWGSQKMEKPNDLSAMPSQLCIYINMNLVPMPLQPFSNVSLLLSPKAVAAGHGRF